MTAMWLLLACTSEPAPEPTPVDAAETTEVVEPVAPAEVPEAVAIRHILVEHENSAGTKRPRTPEEAREVALELRARIVAGEDMRELAFAHSEDLGSRPRGGWLGVGEDGSWVAPFQEVAFSLQVGELSQPVETPFGWHILRREDHTPVVLKHLVVRHAGSANSPLATASDRTLAEAKERAEAARARIAAGEDFGDVAREVSDGPYAADGGDLGQFLKGELGPDIDTVVDATPPGELSEVFTTPHGAHVILRIE